MKENVKSTGWQGKANAERPEPFCAVVPFVNHLTIASFWKAKRKPRAGEREPRER